MLIFWVLFVSYDKMVNVLFFTIYLAHIYIACVCTFIHAVYTEDKYIKNKGEEKATDKLIKQYDSVDEWYRPVHFMDGLFCQ